MHPTAGSRLLYQENAPLERDASHHIIGPSEAIIKVSHCRAHGRMVGAAPAATRPLALPPSCGHRALPHTACSRPRPGHSISANAIVRLRRSGAVNGAPGELADG